MSINYGAASSFAVVAYDNLTNSGTVTGDVAYTTGTAPTFSPAIGGGTVTQPVTPAITDAINVALGQINGLTPVTTISNNNLNTEFSNTLDITGTGTNVYTAANLTNSAPFTIKGGPNDYAVFRVIGTINFGFSIFASYPQNITFRALSNTTLANGTYSGTYISSMVSSNINISNSKIIGRAFGRHNIDMNSNSTIYLPGFLPPISLGLAENYAMLGSKFLYIDLNNTNSTITGFMGSNFISYTPAQQSYPIDSNGINTNRGTIPNAPIVNGAAAKQAIEDVNTAITQYLNVGEVYNGAGGDLSAIITAVPGRYTINGNLTTSADVTLTGSATDIYVFNVTGNINITKNITLSGDLLPQNVIFIASGTIDIQTINTAVTVSGIYISTGNYADIYDSTLTGRLISTCTNTNNTIDGDAGCGNSTITAPQFA